MARHRSAALCIALGVTAFSSGTNFAAPGVEFATTKEGIVGSFRRAVPDVDFDTAKARDEKDKLRVTQRQRQLLEERYDLTPVPA
jgi:hypothetical protein